MAAATTVLICLGLLMIIYWPVQDWIHVPLTYEGDGLWNLFVIKTVLETGWYAGNSRLGAPFGADFLDFAKPEVLHLAFYRLAGLFTQHIALIHNLFYALGFPLVALSALLVLRKAFDLSWALAVSGAVLFAFIPYHVLRLEHLFLASYFAVPLAGWLVLGLARDTPWFFEKGRAGLSHWTVWLALFVVASTSIYYAFFGLCLMAAVGLLEALRQRAWRPLASAAILGTLLSGMVLVNLAPSLWKRSSDGPNPVVAVRSFAEQDVYALRPLQMLLPVAEHRAPALRAWTQRYESQALFVNENRAASIGLIASVGFLASLLVLLSGHRIGQTLPAVGVAARANAAAVLLAVAGGAGAFIALVADPQFRVLNRVSVFIAFFSLGAGLLLLQHLLTRRDFRPTRPVGALLAGLLIMLGVWDQTPGSLRPSSQRITEQYLADRSLVRALEQEVPEGARILQWPHIPFPETAPAHREGGYASLRGYLHASHLRWSHGGMAGRPGDLWHQALSGLPVADQVEVAMLSGFHGIWLQRLAYPDGAARIERELHAQGIRPTVESQDGSVVFYPLNPRGDSPVPLVLGPQLGKGFYPWESHENTRWAWTRGDANLVISSMHPAPRNVQVTLGLRTLVNRRVRVVVDGDTVASIDLKDDAVHTVAFNHRFTQPQHTVQLITDTPAHPPGGNDRRPLAMALTSFQMSDSIRD